MYLIILRAILVLIITLLLTYKIRFHILFNHLSLGKVYILNTY